MPDVLGAQIDAATAHSILKDIPVDAIDRNPENPRIVFRQKELEELLESIRRYGVQVPISVYRDSNRYVLIDGERRWKCSLKLNRKTIPALIQSKPDSLDNLLLMFNIHALREQWDLLTIAIKLPRVVNLLKSRLKREPNERELAEHTGLTRAVIRRCKYLIELPAVYREQILTELGKPKSQQRLTEDFFIEMERALKTVQRAVPSAVDDRDRVRRVLIDKFKRDVIDNRVHFRMVAKIARAKQIGADPRRAERALDRLFQRNDYSITEAYNASVAEAYAERDVLSRVSALTDMLRGLQAPDLDAAVVKALRQLIRAAQRLVDEAG
jgi:ParB family transcriptional regulator, chromosome partitioning protein